LQAAADEPDGPLWGVPPADRRQILLAQAPFIPGPCMRY